MAALTLFTTCKPFTGEFERIQTNALRSWARLTPHCDVIVFGNEFGVAEQCRELGFRNVEDVPRNRHGTPVLDGLLGAAEKFAQSDVLAFVNADIVLTDDLFPAIELVRVRFHEFLLLVRRWNLEITERIDFSRDDWEPRLRALARDKSRLEPPWGGSDLFVYPRGMWRDLKPFAIGRGKWDNALIYTARKMRVPVIDATPVVTCFHQSHGYSHHPANVSGVVRGEESVQNSRLLGGEECNFSAIHATHILTPSGIRKHISLGLAYIRSRIVALPALHEPFRVLLPLIQSLASAWRRLRYLRIKQRVKRSPYPILVGALPDYPGAIHGVSGVDLFDAPDTQVFNRAVLGHLRSLKLPIHGKTVLDIGCGVGSLAQFFVEEGCDVLCVDGRAENIDHLRERYPHLKAKVFNLESEPIASLGRFDVVFAYGLIHHLENPLRAIRDLGSVCDELLFLEVAALDHDLPIVRMEEEVMTNSRSLSGIGSRPSPSFIVLALRTAGFRYIYVPRTMPDHPSFKHKWKCDLSDSKDGHPIRCTFIASRTPLSADVFVNVLSLTHLHYPGGTRHV